MTALVIRTMSRTELDLGIDWAAAEGWNPGLHDADAFHAADPQGYLVGLLGDEPVGMIAAVRYGEGFGFIGFYIVRPAWRGRGHGLALWQAGMQSLSGRLVGLDGVVAHQANYQRSGFELAYNNIRHQGTAMAAGSPDPQIVPISQIPVEQVVRYDAALSPDDRRSFLKAWLSLPGSIGLALMQGERLAGYGAIRPCRQGFKVGPLLADDAGVAERLLRALLAAVPSGALVQFDTPAINAKAIALARSLGMSPVFETARMYTGAAPLLPLERLFGVTSFELG
jgi:ribosomal protein S18 acetylase RimI-like enzyme